MGKTFGPCTDYSWYWYLKKESSNFDGMPTNIYDDGNIITFFPHMESFQDRLSEYLVWKQE